MVRNTLNQLSPESTLAEYVLSLFAVGLKTGDSISISIIPLLNKFLILVCLKSWLSLCNKVTASWFIIEDNTRSKRCDRRNTALSQVFVFCFFLIFCLVHLLTVGLVHNIGRTPPFSLPSLPAGHGVPYLEYMTHMDADHWQKEGEQFLYKWYLKITKLEHDWRPRCTRRGGRRERGIEISLFHSFIFFDDGGGSGHFLKHTAGLMMIHCGQLWFESANGREESEANGVGWGGSCPCFCSNLNT